MNPEAWHFRQVAEEVVSGACDHGGNYRSGDNWHCLTCPHVWPVSVDPEGRGGERAE